MYYSFFMENKETRIIEGREYVKIATIYASTKVGRIVYKQIETGDIKIRRIMRGGVYWVEEIWVTPNAKGTIYIYKKNPYKMVIENLQIRREPWNPTVEPQGAIRIPAPWEY